MLSFLLFMAKIMILSQLVKIFWVKYKKENVIHAD